MDSLYQQALRYRPWEICLLPPRTCPLASMWTERLASLPISIKDRPSWLTSHRDQPSQVDSSTDRTFTFVPRQNGKTRARASG